SYTPRAAQSSTDTACHQAKHIKPPGDQPTKQQDRRKLGLAHAPPVDQLVVCHGDACAPNTVLLEDGRLSGHVDLGALGVADRWADLAIATWSTEWNYGPGWDGPLLAAYGVDPDPERIAYYRLLWGAAGVRQKPATRPCKTWSAA
ncbi:MAG: phosphotransferase, partial [Pseudonocardiaceae bacterium]